jgi:hypothetical protein
LIVWVIAGLLGMATGLRIGWALVNQQSVVSSAMIVALGSLALVAVLNWPPLTLLVDTALRWPNISAAGSCVMITSVASTRRPAVTRRLAMFQYALAAVIAALTLALFMIGERQPEMAPAEYLSRNLGTPNTALDWLVPLLYVLLALTLVSWVGLRLSNSSRRGRALFLFTAGIAVLIRAVSTQAAAYLVGVGTAATLLLCAMAIVAAGALLPSVEDWIGARRELRLIEPLRREMESRHPDIGIGVRPRGPLVYRVAERLSLISDALYLEGAEARRKGGGNADEEDPPAGMAPADQARAVAGWIGAGSARAAEAFPGRRWLRQPADCSDREWILEIARQYRALDPCVGEGDGSSADTGRD